MCRVSQTGLDGFCARLRWLLSSLTILTRHSSHSSHSVTKFTESSLTGDMLVKLLIIAVAYLFGSSLAIKLPSYMKPCSRNEPNLTACATNSGRAAIPELVKGDRKYKIPNLIPFLISEMKVPPERLGLTIHLKDAKIYGLEKVQVKEIRPDLVNQTFHWHMLIPRVLFLSKYNVSGQILILPITGNGDANITIDNLDFIYKSRYTKYAKGPKNEEYMRPQRGTIDFTVTRIYIRLENLFNGDRLLGPQMNIFLNENWKEASKEVGPAIAEAIGEIIHSQISRISEIVSYNEMFPEKV